MSQISKSTSIDNCRIFRRQTNAFRALFLDRSANPQVRKYQDWVEGPDYAGKSEVAAPDARFSEIDSVTNPVVAIS